MLQQRYIENERDLAKLKIDLAIYIATKLNTDDIKTIEHLNYLTFRIMSAEKRAEFLWNGLTPEQQEKMEMIEEAKKGA